MKVRNSVSNPKSKISRSKFIVIAAAVLIILFAGAAIAYTKHSSNCVDIIGDGYAMGTDPEPIVIGNTCD